ncbi:RNA polymerase sigma factor SigI [Bacillus spongiae]|uniref:RNA polymerase sigma factor SigI n=1 Tax=Bacillus spongiae TaxID=2683610 RepID=A0ABU8H9D9_9BACI
MLNLLLLLLTRKKKLKSLEQQVLEIQNGDERALEELLQSYHPFIKKTVSSVCKRYIYESDDEFSVGLIAFHEAILKYQPEKGSSLLSLAEVIIKRKVIDYLRKNNKDNNISIDSSYATEQDDDSSTNLIENSISLENYEKEKERKARQEEILQYQQLLATYDLTFEDLIEQSPKHEDARVNAINIAKLIAEDDGLLSILETKKRLPMKQLVEKVHVSRKTVERNRKYIIAVTLILTKDFYYLRDYLKGRIDT